MEDQGTLFVVSTYEVATMLNQRMAKGSKSRAVFPGCSLTGNRFSKIAVMMQPDSPQDHEWLESIRCLLVPGGEMHWA